MISKLIERGAPLKDATRTWLLKTRVDALAPLEMVPWSIFIVITAGMRACMAAMEHLPCPVRTQSKHPRSEPEIQRHRCAGPRYRIPLGRRPQNAI